jgi:hypothetical protein
MPPKLRSHKHHTKILWHLVPHRRCTIDWQESKEYFRRQLEEFRQYIRDHYIGEFGSSHKVFGKGKYSPQFYATLLCSLLALDTIPDLIKVPCWHLLHVCAHCYAHPYPPNLWVSLFVHVSAVPRRRGRPSRHQDITSSELALSSSRDSSVDCSSSGSLVDSEAFHGYYDSD